MIIAKINSIISLAFLKQKKKHIWNQAQEF